MRKFIVSIAAAAIVLFSGAAFAQSQVNDRPAKFNPFDGIQLTQDQQQRLQVLREGLGPVKLTKEQQEKVYGDKKNLSDEQKKQMKEEANAKKLESKKNYLNGVKEILSPDQYVVFLENVYLYSPDQSHKAGTRGNMKSPRNKEGRKMEAKKKGGHRHDKKESEKAKN
ncbi:MAG: hypothetical protein J1E78_07505 [Muribaculaceae bacterium]|nr:hypothetical protein [Muribaculaceae bacterium]